jgi:hypothetical protein
MTAVVGASALAQPAADFDFADELRESRRLAAQPLTAGHFSLAWVSDLDGGFFRVESSPSEDFAGAVVYYEGPQRQAYISGLEEGEHYFRIAAKTEKDADWSDWSDSASLTVSHHDLGVAFVFAGIGAVLFGCIVAFVIIAPRKVEA